MVHINAEPMIANLLIKGFAQKASNEHVERFFYDHLMYLVSGSCLFDFYVIKKSIRQVIKC